MISISLGRDPDTAKYMEVLSGREDFPGEAFRRASEEDLVVRGGGFQSGLRGHQSENLALMGTMRPLVKNRTTVIVLIANKSLSQWTMDVQKRLNTNILHQQMENILGGMSI